MCRSVSPTYLFSSSGPLMLRKKLLPSLAWPSLDLAVPSFAEPGASAPVSPRSARCCRGPGRHLLGQGVGHRLGDQRLAAAGRPVQQHALGRPQLVLPEQVRVQVRQLHRIPDLDDLRAQAADVGVGDVRHFLEDELLDLGLGDALVDVAGPRLQQQRVARAQHRVEQRLGQPDHPLLVGMRDHQRPVAALEQLLEHDDLAHGLVPLGDHHVERLVEHDLLAGPQLVQLDGGADADPHLAAAGEHVGGAVLGGRQEHAETRRRLGQPVDFLLERHDLVARFAERVGQPLVLAGHGGQAGLRLTQPLLEQADVPGRVGQPAPQHRHLLLEEGDLRGEALNLVVVPRGARSFVTTGHAPTPFREQTSLRPYLSVALA